MMRWILQRGNQSILIKLYSIWSILEICLENVKKIIVKDPLEPLTETERKIIIYSRDYICTIPSALEVFLRSINWFNPIQVNLARIYIKRWAKIDPEDAISLLDARYPDTFVREYAVSILSEMTDDLLNLYMLQMCQSLMYELYHITPLADFLIEKSLKSPNIVGCSFYWNAAVCMRNKLFRERLCVITTQILMLSGPKFISIIQKSSLIDKQLKSIALDAKERYNSKSGDNKKEETRQLVKDRVRGLNMSEFQFPIHASYFADKFDIENCNIFGSKMVPICLAAKSTDNSDNSGFNVIYKCGIKYL